MKKQRLFFAMAEVSKKKAVLLFLFVGLFFALMTGCSGKSSLSSPDTTAPLSDAVPSSGTASPESKIPSMRLSNSSGESWTVLVYLCGTDLETTGGCATTNIVEMAEAAASDKINVLFQTGGTKEWMIDGIDPGELQRYQAKNGNIELLDSKPLASMGSADTLGSFLRWGVETYPADKYACILWNHGSGSVDGIAFDELFEMDSLDLNELSQGIAQAGVQFELIGFDACLMATLETAAVLAPYGRYMVASQELEPGSGWNYTVLLDSLVQNTTQTGLELGRTICDSFYEKCAADDSESLVTLSVTDLSQIPALVQSFDQMAAEMKTFTAVPEKLQPLTQAMLRAENYGGNNDNEGYTNMVDLGDIVRCAEGIVSQTGDLVLENLAKAVPYAVEGRSRGRSNGLSVYVPLYVEEGNLDQYAAVAFSGEYLRFLEGLYDWTIPENAVISQPMLAQSEAEGESTPEAQTFSPIGVQEVPVSELSVAHALNQNDFSVSFTTSLTEDGYVMLHIEEGAEVVQSIVYNLFYMDEESNSLLFLGSDYDVNSDDTGTLYWDNFRNVWPTINGNTCSLLPLEWGENYILYTVPILLSGEQTNLRMTYYYDDASYEIVGTWDGIDTETGMSSREIHHLKEGDQVEFLFGAAELDTGEAYQFEYGGFIVEGDPIIQESELFEAEFYYQYEITDIFGKIYTSDFAIINSKNGEIIVEMEE